MWIGRPKDRHDLPFRRCLGGCNAKTLRWFYYCTPCTPEDHDKYNPNIEYLESRSKILRESEKAENIKKARTDKARKQQYEYKRAMNMEVEDEKYDY